MDWNEFLKLPDAALAGYKRIPKTVLSKQAMLTKHEQKTLDKVASLRHFATVQKSTTRILPYIDGERDIQSVVFLACEMAGKSEAYAEVASLLHKSFPNPTVLLFSGSGSVCLSVAITRLSRAETGATVVDRVESSGPFECGSSAYSVFLDSLSFDMLSQEDLLCYLNSFAWNVKLARTISMLGFYPCCPETSRERLIDAINRYESLGVDEREIEEKRRDKDISLNDAAKLRMEMKGIKKERDSVVQDIKEICNE